MPADKQNLQDAFLNHVRKTKVPVTIFLINGNHYSNTILLKMDQIDHASIYLVIDHTLCRIGRNRD